MSPATIGGSEVVPQICQPCAEKLSDVTGTQILHCVLSSGSIMCSIIEGLLSNILSEALIRTCTSWGTAQVRTKTPSRTSVRSMNLVSPSRGMRRRIMRGSELRDDSLKSTLADGDALMV